MVRRRKNGNAEVTLYFPGNDKKYHISGWIGSSNEFREECYRKRFHARKNQDILISVKELEPNIEKNGKTEDGGTVEKTHNI